MEEGLRLLKHLVAKSDATTAFTAAEHGACSSLDHIFPRDRHTLASLWFPHSLHCCSEKKIKTENPMHGRL